MSTLTLRVAEFRVELDAEPTDADVVEKALEAALRDLATGLRARLVGTDAPRTLALGDIFVRKPAARKLVAGPDFRRLTEAIRAEIEARLAVAP